MAFSRRHNFKPKPPQCAQCGREDAILTRPDKLGNNCGRFADESRRAIEKHKTEQTKR